MNNKLNIIKYIKKLFSKDQLVNTNIISNVNY